MHISTPEEKLMAAYKEMWAAQENVRTSRATLAKQQAATRQAEVRYTRALDAWRELVGRVEPPTLDESNGVAVENLDALQKAAP